MIERADLTLSPVFPRHAQSCYWRKTPVYFRRRGQRRAAVTAASVSSRLSLSSTGFGRPRKTPRCLSIKQTLYRTNESSELVEALAEAATKWQRGNRRHRAARYGSTRKRTYISPASLQEAGAVVVYGVMGYKTHAKMLLIVRRIGGALKRYAHLGTGNYHRKNSLLYTDYSLLTSDEVLCADVHKVFQQITGNG